MPGHTKTDAVTGCVAVGEVCQPVTDIPFGEDAAEGSNRPGLRGPGECEQPNMKRR